MNATEARELAQLALDQAKVLRVPAYMEEAHERIALAVAKGRMRLHAKVRDATHDTFGRLDVDDIKELEARLTDLGYDVAPFDDYDGPANDEEHYVWYVSWAQPYVRPVRADESDDDEDGYDADEDNDVDKDEAPVSLTQRLRASLSSVFRSLMRVMLGLKHCNK